MQNAESRNLKSNRQRLLQPPCLRVVLRLSPTINITAMTNINHQHKQQIVLDGVDNTIITDSDAICVFPFELHAAMRSRIVGERFQPFGDSTPDRLRQPCNYFVSRRAQSDCISQCLNSPFFTCFFEGNCFHLPRVEISETLPRNLSIPLILLRARQLIVPPTRNNDELFFADLKCGQAHAKILPIYRL
jgi:hypothetical protein